MRETFTHTQPLPAVKVTGWRVPRDVDEHRRMRLWPFLRTLRAGDTRGRLIALWSTRVALDVAVTGAALRSGLLEDLRRPADLEEVAAARGWPDASLVEAALQSFAAHGLVETRRGKWRTARRGRRLLDDELTRAAYEAFSTYHTGLYRDLDEVLSMGGGRKDVEVDGELIARLSRFMDEFVFAELDRLVAERSPRRMLDVGCATGTHLRHVLEVAPRASAVGVEVDPAAAALARASLSEGQILGRAEIIQSDVERFLVEHPGEMFDFILLANAVYYIPVEDRVVFLRALADRLEEGGRIVIVTTTLTTDSFSRHFDFLLRSQTGALELPETEALCEQLRRAGLVPRDPRRIATGQPLTAVVADRPASL
jgi:SAM-dependent methyltransferase